MRTISLATSLRLAWKTFRKQRLSEDDGYLFDELKPGDIAIDCGANIGVITEKMAARGALVHAFEPDPNAFSVLREKFADSENIILHNCAVSNEEGLMDLYFRQEQPSDPIAYSVGSTLIPSKTDIDLGHSISVPVVSLADFLTKQDLIRMLKIDIEGAECDVLEDLLKYDLLGRIDLVLVETHEEWIPDLRPRLEKLRVALKQAGHRHVYLNWI